MVKKLKILAIGAHPDDIEYYAGGTLSKLSHQHKVVIIVATDGGYGSNSLIRKKEQNKAARIIGAKKVIYLDFPDGKLEFATRMLKNRIFEIFLLEKPDIIFSFDPYHQHIIHNDFHPDHRTIANVVADVALIDATIAKLAKPKLWLYDAYEPNKTINIKIELENKNKAIREFKSQKLEVSSSNFEKFRVY